jgi:arylamine N-acetyltransferase
VTNSIYCQNALEELEALILKLFQDEPFHNLYLLFGKEPLSNKHGGTCSDKTLSFISAANTLGFDATLHTGYIGGKEIHRLSRVTIDNRSFFADVGNGWPSIKLYPADEEISFTSFGMKYRTVISNNRISVFHLRNGKESLQLEIDPAPRQQEDVKESIAQRFSSGIKYPFCNSLRFSLVVGTRFLFLRGERLEIYADDGFSIVDGIAREHVAKVLNEQFHYDSTTLFAYLTGVE